MFTGLVAAVGTVRARTRVGEELRLRVDVAGLPGLHRIGDSIALSGVCCTVIALFDGVAEFHLSTETLRRTWLGRAAVGDKLNLETALRAGDPLGGHLVQGHVDGTGSVVTQFNSVSATTYDVVAAVLGVSIDADRSIIAGTVYGCDEEPIEAAQVIVVDDAGNRPDGLVIHYMVDEFPDRDQPWTSEDGLWVALDVPAGDWTIEAWGVVGGTLQQIGATKLRAEADSINISNIYVGYGDGVKYPDACLAN